MKIIILGAGQVGSSVAMSLATEFNDITVVDRDPELLQALQNKLDLRTVLGSAAHPDVLMQAGADDADLILAVTNSDETNMVACQVAYTLFRTPKKIARVRELAFTLHPELFNKGAIPIDVLISPEQLVTDYVMRLIEYPGALQVLDFAQGKVRLVEVRAVEDGPLVQHPLKDLYEHMPNVDARVAAIYRDGQAIEPTGETIIKPDDEVFFIAAAENIRAVMSELRKLERPFRRIIIAGGGNIGKRLANQLQGKYRVKLIERDRLRAKKTSEELKDIIVLHGDAGDESLLFEENISETDLFCAVTNDDEANILSAMLAKRLGARKVMCLINRASYVDLVKNTPIDNAISPQLATIGSLLTHVRRGDVAKVHSIRRDSSGGAEAIEAIAHGDSTSSRVIGRSIEQLNLPAGTSIGAIVRDEEVIIAHHDTVIKVEDHVILFMVDKRKIQEIEKLFYVQATFL